MDTAIRKPSMTRAEFFDWAQTQDTRYEFDGFDPVAMTGGTADHDVITFNVRTALRGRLKSGTCHPFGPNAGVATDGDAVRYPDGLITCAKVSGDAHVIPEVIVVFEVLSRTFGRTDRIDKLREYRDVPSILRYVILESASIGLVVHERANAGEAWRTTALTEDDTLRIPEVGIEIPVCKFYADVDFSTPDGQAAG